MLRAINSDLIAKLSKLDDVLYSRLINLLCNWASSSGFEWDYCDIIGDRLLSAYRISPVRLKCKIVLSSLELAVSHNRWHVMSQVGGMLGKAAEDGLVERILIEIQLNSSIAQKLRNVEHAIKWKRSNWHEKIKLYLNKNYPI